MRLILASKSETRKKIMDRLNLKYDIISSDAKEISYSKEPIKYCEELSVIKAKSAMSKLNKKNCIILAADSVIYYNGKIYEKPKSSKEAIANLTELSGTKNLGITGVTLIDTNKNKMITFSCVTEVYLKNISKDDINWYVEHEKDLLNKAGYSLEGIMSLFVDKICGDYYNVLGLPLGIIYTKINEMGYELQDFD